MVIWEHMEALEEDYMKYHAWKMMGDENSMSQV
jgi:hypothetical protein